MARRKRKRSYGTGSVYQNRGRWAAKWRAEEGVRHSYGHATREDAEQALKVALAGIHQGAVSQARSTRTLAVLFHDWIEARKVTHRSWEDDLGRWTNHIAPSFGHLRPHQIDKARLCQLINDKLTEGLATATVQLLLRLLSTFFSDLVEEGAVAFNPVRSLPSRVKRLVRPTYDWRSTPFVRRMADVRQTIATMDEPYSVAYAIGALAGLRPGEVIALSWDDVDVTTRRIIVRHQVQDAKLAAPKDRDARVVPIQDALAPILAAWQLKTGGAGLLFVPTRGGNGEAPARFMSTRALHRALRRAQVQLGLPTIEWYEATRHTFASHWVLAGGSIERLSTVLGHSSITITERYAHLSVDLFPQSDYALLGAA